jgi:hypothetical protein
VNITISKIRLLVLNIYKINNKTNKNREETRLNMIKIEIK